MNINKKSLIIAGVVVLVAVVLAIITTSRPGIFEEPIADIEPEIRDIKLKMSTGYSVSSEDIPFEEKEKNAVNEAYNEMMEGLEEEPSFVVLTSTVGFDQEKLLKEVRELLPEETKIYGYTSLFGLMTREGFKVGEGVEEGNVLGIMGFAGDEFIVGIGGAGLDEEDSPEKVSKLALERALEDAGKDIAPKIIMMSSAPFGAGEDLFVKGVENIMGKEVPIVGGGAAAGYADLVSGGQALFANDKIYEAGVVVAAIDANIRIGHAFLGGFDPIGFKGVATEVTRDERGIRLVTIDDRPAAEVYNEWMDGEFDEFLGTSDMLLHRSLYYTFGIKVLEDDGTENWHMVVALHFNPDNSISLGTNIPEGTEFHLLKSDSRLLIDRLEPTIRLARGRGGIPEDDIAGVLVDLCGASLLGIPERSDWDVMVDKALQASGDAPFMGASNLGPYGHFMGVGNRYGEVTPSVLIFGKY